MLSDDERQAAADALFKADASRTVIGQLSKTYPGMDIEDAYDVHRHWAQRRVANGARIVGRKIGLTSRAMQLASRMTGTTPSTMMGRPFPRPPSSSLD